MQAFLKTMMNKNYLLAIILLLFPIVSFAGLLKGKITDDKGISLPYATIYIQGTTKGTTANSDGAYEFVLEPGNYKIVCQYIGFKQNTYSVNILGNETVQHDFKLADESLHMKEVVIHANDEDPAYPIIRKTIERRKFHLQQVKSFQTGIYLKGVFRSRKLPSKHINIDINGSGAATVDSNGKGVLYLVEEDADYYAEGGKERTVIHSVHESGNPGGYGISRFPSVVTFYENNVNLIGGDSRGFISPISDNALSYYKYKLEGEFTENGYTIYKIKVTPKRLYEPTFYGNIYVVDGDWAMHSADLFLVKKSNLDFFDTLGVRQLFLPMKKDTWVAKSQLIYFAISLFGFDVNGSMATVYDKQKVNEPIPDTIFNNKVISSYDKGANKKDTSYWTEARPIPLEGDESKNYRVKDSVYKIVHSQKYLDSVRIAHNMTKVVTLLYGNKTWNSKGYKNIYTLNPILFSPDDYYENGMMNYNTIEGFNLAPKLDWRHKVDTEHTLHGAIAVRYGFSNKHFNSIAKLEYTEKDLTWRGRTWTVGVQGGKYVFQYNPEDPVPPLFNSVSTLFWRENDMKIYERWEGTAYMKRVYGNGLKWDIRLSYQQRLPLENTNEYSIADLGSYSFTSNLPPHLAAITTWEQHDAMLAHASVSYQPGYKYILYPDYKRGYSTLPVFTLTYDKGIPNLLNSKVDYDKWRATIEGFVRLRLLGSLSYSVSAGGFLNSNYVSAPDLMHLYGNRGIGFASAYLHSFQFAQYYDWSNKEPLYGEVHLEYNLQGLLSNKIPLLRQAQWYLLLGTNSFYAKQSDYYTEAFIGVDNLGWKAIRFLRIDFVQSWDSNMGRNSGIRFGVKLPGETTNTVIEDDVW